MPPILKYFLLSVLFIAANFLLYSRYQQINNPVINLPVPTPTSLPSPTTATQKSWSDLRLSIQNGSGKTGFAGTIAAKFKASGLGDITTGNADSSDYAQSVLTFASSELKDAYSSKFTAIFPITESNITVDINQSFDAILILGVK